mmetsp:Transcript_49798/g.83459  ORF Transcript_49798/g.83459 Transcript_49798/m.83459 type:complete len:262 (-) Transcript_49798:314-1099(-)
MHRPQSLQVQIHATHEIGQCWIVHHANIHCFSQRQQYGILRCLLLLARPQGHFQIADVAELGVILVVGVHEMLDLRQLELPQAHEPPSGGDLVAEGRADRGSRKRHPSTVEIIHLLKIHEDSLGQLGSQVSFLLSLGTDLRLKHEIKAERRLQRIALRGADAKAGHGGSHLFLTHNCHTLLNISKGASSLRIHFLMRIIKPPRAILSQVRVQSKAFACFDVFRHDVVEPLDMPRRDEHVFGCQTSSRNLQHGLLKHEMRPP